MVLSESADLFEFAGDAVELTHRGSFDVTYLGPFGVSGFGFEPAGRRPVPL